ncbi:MAG: hypothetical protein QGG36_15960 [Pirellulaceae bacterium]|jgi:hypothetical protein|nr:hypothetical protein [Pirellulaceae bacterium]MDP7017300.1 hypothetical protein [Pirellulaceae bacterium]
MGDLFNLHALIERQRTSHDGIRKAFSAVEREIFNSESRGNGSLIRTALVHLETTLNAHFAEELQGGCLEEAVCLVPRLSKELSRIEKERATISERIEQLIERAGGYAAEDFQSSFRRFAVLLRGHEAAENWIIQSAFGGDDVGTANRQTASEFE